MFDIEFTIWLLFLLGFVILPVKPVFRFCLNRFCGNCTKKIMLRIDEENYGEKRDSQLYRPGDKKYDRIVKLSNSAKSLN